MYTKEGYKLYLIKFINKNICRVSMCLRCDTVFFRTTLVIWKIT